MRVAHWALPMKILANIRRLWGNILLPYILPANLEIARENQPSWEILPIYIAS